MSGHLETRFTSAQFWPTAAEWTKDQRVIESFTSHKLAIATERVAHARIRASQALDVLGPDSFVEFTSVRTPGSVIWCNFEVARQLGFDVPQSNELTPALHEQLLAALSFRAVNAAEDFPSHETITMYADRYSGEGVRPVLGAGRAGFLPYGNLYVKGVGFTPLFRHDDPSDFAHSHGAVHLDDCLWEAVFGEVNENLFSLGASRVVAVIDQGRYVTAPSGRKIPVGLLVRAGLQLRPAHLLSNHKRPTGSLLRKFISIARATEQLITRQHKPNRRDIPDVKATMLRIIDDHARTAAEGFRWRMIHGALSSSNMEMSGAMLDVATQSSQPRTAPVWWLYHADSVFGTEHTRRAFQLIPPYRALIRNTKRAQRELFNIRWLNISGQMDKAYMKHLQVQLLSAVGMKTDVARRIQADQPQLARCFTELILNMVSLKNPGSVCVAKSMVEHVSVLDVFHLLGSLPQTYFANPNADHKNIILTCLKPVFRGNRFHVAKKRTMVKVFAGQFADLYRELMNAVSDYCGDYYGDLKKMEASITARAGFENRPLDFLCAKRLHDDLNKSIAAYKATGNAALIREAIDQRISASLRSVDGLLSQGKSRRIADGGIELEMRTIEGVNYSVRAWNDKAQKRRLHVSIPVEHHDHYYWTSVSNLGRLTKRQIDSLYYRFKTDEWKTYGRVRGCLKHDEQDALVIDFDEIRAFPSIGRLEGCFQLAKLQKPISSIAYPQRVGYVFAIPDRHELMKMVVG